MQNRFTVEIVERNNAHRLDQYALALAAFHKDARDCAYSPPSHQSSASWAEGGDLWRAAKTGTLVFLIASNDEGEIQAVTSLGLNNQPNVNGAVVATDPDAHDAVEDARRKYRRCYMEQNAHPSASEEDPLC